MQKEIFDEYSSVKENRKALQRIIARGVASGVVLGLFVFSVVTVALFFFVTMWLNDQAALHRVMGR